MANPYLVLWCDPASNLLYSNWNDNAQASTPVLKQGDTLGVEIHWVAKGNLSTPMVEIDFPPSSNVTLAIGLLDTVPTDGTFTLSYGGDTTTELQHDATATVVSTALNLLPSIIDEGGVSVIKNNNQYRIVWDEKGVYSDALTCEVANLSPSSNFTVIEPKAGTALSNRILVAKLSQSPIAGTSTFTKVSDPAISCNEVSDGLFRIEIYPAPKSGSFQLTLTIGTNTFTTSPIMAFSPKEEVLSAILDAISPIPFDDQPKIVISDYGQSGYDIFSSAKGTQQPISGISIINNLKGFSALYGTVSLNTFGVEELVSGRPAIQAVLEVQADIDGEVQTLAQTNIIILNDLIENSTFESVDLGSVMPLASVVRYDTSQSLSSAQKLQARQNIDALATGTLTSLETDVNVLEGQMAVANAKITTAEADIVALEAKVVQPVLVTSSPTFVNVTLTTGGITFGDGTTLTTTPVAASLAPYMQKASNLSDVASVSTARTNLGLGTMAVETATNYLTKAGNLSGLASVSTARTNLGLGTIAVEAAADYLTKAGNLSGLASTSTARTNLGLGTIATEASADYLAKADNLSGLASTSTSRTNLGLGSTDSVAFGGVSIGSGGLTFADTTTQDTAGPNTPSDPLRNWIAVWNSTAWGSSELAEGGVLFDSTLLSSGVADFGATVSSTGGPAIRISNDGTNWTELTPEGVKFADGSTITTSSTTNITYAVSGTTWKFVESGTSNYESYDCGYIKEIKLNSTGVADGIPRMDAELGSIFSTSANYNAGEVNYMKIVIDCEMTKEMAETLVGISSSVSVGSYLSNMIIGVGSPLELTPSNWTTGYVVIVNGDAYDTGFIPEASGDASRWEIEFTRTNPLSSATITFKLYRSSGIVQTYTRTALVDLSNSIQKVARIACTDSDNPAYVGYTQSPSIKLSQFNITVPSL